MYICSKPVLFTIPSVFDAPIEIRVDELSVDLENDKS
jgi:hypothetical protein